MTQQEFIISIFLKNKSQRETVQEFTDAADDAGFELKEIVTTSSETIERPSDPSQTVSEAGFYKSTFVQRGHPRAITFAEGSSPSDSPYDVYVVHLRDLNRELFTTGGQRIVLSLVRSLAQQMTPHMMYLGKPGDGIVASRDHLSQDFGLGYITYYGSEISEKLNADIPSTPVGLVEPIEDGWLIASGEDFMENVRQLDEISDFLGVRCIRY